MSLYVYLFVCFIFILLSRESDGGAVFWTTLNLLLVRSHQAEIIIVKRLIQRRNNVSDEGGSWTWIT